MDASLVLGVRGHLVACVGGTILNDRTMAFFIKTRNAQKNNTHTKTDTLQKSTPGEGALSQHSRPRPGFGAFGAHVLLRPLSLLTRISHTSEPSLSCGCCDSEHEQEAVPTSVSLSGRGRMGGRTRTSQCARISFRF